MMRCATTLIVSVCLLACAERRASTVPFTLEHGLVFLEVEFPDHGPVLALLDTGANASAVDGRVASDLPVLGMSEVTGTTGSIEVENVRLDGLGLGSLRLPSLRATRRDLSGLLAPQGRTVGLILGSDALMELAVTIDFAASRLEVSTRPKEGLPEGVTMRMDNGIPAIEGNLAGLDLWLRIDTAASLFETEDIYVNIPTHAWEALRALHGKRRRRADLRSAGGRGPGSTARRAGVRSGVRDRAAGGGLLRRSSGQGLRQQQLPETVGARNPRLPVRSAAPGKLTVTGPPEVKGVGSRQPGVFGPCGTSRSLAPRCSSWR
jgi:hypothetical protein